MNPTDDRLIHFIQFAFTFVFTAGVAWGTFKRMQRDVNSIGNKVREMARVSDKRYHNASVAIIVAAPPEKEAQISELLKE